MRCEHDQYFEFLNDYYVNNDLESGLSSDFDNSFIDEDEIFRKKLAAWAKETNITLIAVTKLLMILKVGQTLLDTPLILYRLILECAYWNRKKYFKTSHNQQTIRKSFD